MQSRRSKRSYSLICSRNEKAETFVSSGLPAVGREGGGGGKISASTVPNSRSNSRFSPSREVTPYRRGAVFRDESGPEVVTTCKPVHHGLVVQLAD